MVVYNVHTVIVYIVQVLLYLSREFDKFGGERFEGSQQGKQCGVPEFQTNHQLHQKRAVREASELAVQEQDQLRVGCHRDTDRISPPERLETRRQRIVTSPNRRTSLWIMLHLGRMGVQWAREISPKAVTVAVACCTHIRNTKRRCYYGPHFL